MIAFLYTYVYVVYVHIIICIHLCNHLHRSIYNHISIYVIISIHLYNHLHPSTHTPARKAGREVVGGAQLDGVVGVQREDHVKVAVPCVCVREERAGERERVSARAYVCICARACVSVCGRVRLACVCVCARTARSLSGLLA
jgi:hypothetical protein